MGRWRLADQIDESHRFLFGHIYWPCVKAVIASEREWPEDLETLVNAVADEATRTAHAGRDLLLGISAIALMTLRQVGVDGFAQAPGHVHLSRSVLRRSPQQVLCRRAKDDWQGLLGFTRGMKKRWTVTFDENNPGAAFQIINGQEIATAAQSDKRDYDQRFATPREGLIPVECRAVVRSAGGRHGGADKLSPVVERDEGRRMSVFGYLETNATKPMIRLACQARAFGAVSIVIPPWNGVFGDDLKRLGTEGKGKGQT
jgi:hypothetical protein